VQFNTQTSLYDLTFSHTSIFSEASIGVTYSTFRSYRWQSFGYIARTSLQINDCSVCICTI